jgi:hypothetical protein
MTFFSGRPIVKISWKRLRAMFNDPQPPQQVWEQQFDGFDDVLERLSQTPWGEIDFSDLWYYHHDLAYVELQPELFAYLFPVCLMDWHDSLSQNCSCSHGDSEFHYGVRRGRVFEKMVTPDQIHGIYEFFRDSFLVRLDQERGFVYQASRTPAYGWTARFNSLGLVMPRIDLLWNTWWSLDTPGRAVAAVQYLSGLMYFEGENPFFGCWNPAEGGGGPSLIGNDSLLCDAGWMDENVQFLQETLNEHFVTQRLGQALDVLRDEPEYPKAERIGHDLAERIDIVASRVKELPLLLSKPDAQGWSM